MSEVEIEAPNPAVTYEPQMVQSIPVPTPVCVNHVNYKQTPSLHVVT